ncbi:MAG: hypothetical protein P4N60_10945 [Verrucomicrobiae bacterium]|nr:hypothetical protein [Verrucomicrobiae bacterium]
MFTNRLPVLNNHHPGLTNRPPTFTPQSPALTNPPTYKPSAQSQ